MTATISTVYVVTWEPVSMGGFEWNVSRAAAESYRRSLADPTADVHAVKVPDHLTRAGAWAISEWLDDEGWSDGGDPRRRPV